MRNTSSDIEQTALSYGDKHMGKIGKSRWQLRLGVVFVLATLTACQTTTNLESVQSSSYTSRHPIVVTNDVMTMRVQGRKNQRGLSGIQRERIAAFVSSYKDSGAGPFRIRAPSSAANDVAAASRVAEVRRIIERNAIPRSRVRMVNYYPRKRRGASPVVLSYRHYRAIANKCGAWPESDTITYENKPSWSFGCATQNNLAAMIANPRDLIKPRNGAPADAQRRDKVFAKYREGAVTTAKRGAAETGSVSNVAK